LLTEFGAVWIGMTGEAGPIESHIRSIKVFNHERRLSCPTYAIGVMTLRTCHRAVFALQGEAGQRVIEPIPLARPADQFEFPTGMLRVAANTIPFAIAAFNNFRVVAFAVVETFSYLHMTRQTFEIRPACGHGVAIRTSQHAF
jgi:hypothetical protein